MYYVAQLYERRRKLIKGQEETKKWKEIDYHYMTEESDDTDGEKLHTHKHQWRSQG